MKSKDLFRDETTSNLRNSIQPGTLLFLILYAWGLLALFSPAALIHAQKTAVNIILDTDMGPDSDDAGALAMLHALQNLGEAKILGVMCGTTSPWGAPCIDVINHYYQHPEIPVGTLKQNGPAGGSEEWSGTAFNAYIAGYYPNQIRHGEYASDATEVYRKILSSQPDQSVTIVVTGPVTNLKYLLASPADQYATKTGIALVREKVRQLIVMGGAYPSGKESNFMVDPGATHAVVNTWPTEIVFSGYEIGEEILTCPPQSKTDFRINPVTMIYHLWDLEFARRFEADFDPENGIWPHSSYDQTAVLFAVRGKANYWQLHEKGYNHIFSDGSNEWREDHDKNHAYLLELMPRAELAKEIEFLMAKRPLIQ